MCIVHPTCLFQIGCVSAIDYAANRKHLAEPHRSNRGFPHLRPCRSEHGTVGTKPFLAHYDNLAHLRVGLGTRTPQPSLISTLAAADNDGDGAVTC